MTLEPARNPFSLDHSEAEINKDAEEAFPYR